MSWVGTAWCRKKDINPILIFCFTFLLTLHELPYCSAAFMTMFSCSSCDFSTSGRGPLYHPSTGVTAQCDHSHPVSRLRTKSTRRESTAQGSWLRTRLRLVFFCSARLAALPPPERRPHRRGHVLLTSAVALGRIPGRLHLCGQEGRVLGGHRPRSHHGHSGVTCWERRESLACF